MAPSFPDSVRALSRISEVLAPVSLLSGASFLLACLFLRLFTLVWTHWSPVGSVWLFASFRTACPAAIPARSLVSRWGSWMGLPPFGNLFMLTYTGGYTCDPDFQIVLQAKERLRTQNMFSHQKKLPESIEWVTRRTRDLQRKLGRFL